MDNPVEEIKKRIDIVDYIGSFITLKKAGRNFKAICPFHKEKTPSFIISPDRQIWHCFGACNDGGDIFKFLMKWENITFVEALKELAKRAGVVLKKINFEDKIWKKKERFFQMNFLAAEFFSFLLNKEKYGEKAIDYLKQRNIKKETIKLFNLGYAPNSWNSLKLFLNKKGFQDSEIFENGLLVKGEKNNFYDRFRGRLIFPIKDSRGNILGFSGRILDKEKNEAKYINTPETPIYHKRETLFGIDLSKEAIKKENNVYIVEGEFDMIVPYQFGFKNFVAIKGTALTNEQLLLLKRYTERITLTLDADAAGLESTKRGIEEAERLDFDIRVVRITGGKDPDEAIKKDITLFKKDLKKSMPIYDFLIEEAKKRYPDETPFSKKKIADEVLPFIERINNPIVKSYYVKKIAQFLGVDEKSVEELILRIKKNKKQKIISFSKNQSLKTKDRELFLEKYLLSYLFQNDDPFSLGEIIFKILSVEDFSFLSFQKILKIFLDYKNKEKKFNLNDFVKNLASEIKEVFDEIYLYSSLDEGFLDNKNIEKLLFEIKKNSLKRQIKKILENKSDDENKNRLKILNEELKQVEKNLYH